MAIVGIMSSSLTNKDIVVDDEDEDLTNNNNNAMMQQPPQQQQSHDDHDDHQGDMVMPGFRFHPTEEELVEFYLRRKVEGKRFQVELITFLDLYRYDPWELPAMAAIGEKEWYFYVPRDRKYRNGDRPNRVTTSGYWKATGADRMIRSDNNFRSIGLKKTLVFYSGKAPKGIRTSWIMNEYRLPQHETQRLHPKAEISLCRVYKRAGVVEDHHRSLPRSLSSRPSPTYNRKQPPAPTAIHGFHQTNFVGSSSSSPLQLESHHQYHQQQQMAAAAENMEQMSETEGSSGGTADIAPTYDASLAPTAPATISPAGRILVGGEDGVLLDDFHRLINYQTAAAAAAATNSMTSNDNNNNRNNVIHPFQQQFWQLPPQLLQSAPPPGYSDRLWEWNPAGPPDGNRPSDCTNPHPFK